MSRESVRARRTTSAGTIPVSLSVVKGVLILALVLLILLAGLPLGMAAMGAEMGDCPACSSPSALYALGICAAILTAVVIALLLSGGRIRVAAESLRHFLLTTSIFRPPRTS